MVSNTENSGHFTSLVGIRTVIFLQVFWGICSGSQLEINNDQTLLKGIDKNYLTQNSKLQASTSLKDDLLQTPPSCPNLRNPFFAEKSIQQNPRECELYEENKGGVHHDISFSQCSKAKPKYLKNDFSDGYTNTAKSRQSPYINHSSQMFCQYRTGHTPVRMVCYYNSNNGLGNYYIYRGKRGNSLGNSYFQPMRIQATEQDTLRDTTKQSAGNCFSKKNITTSAKEKFPGYIKREDLSLIMDTLSPIYDWTRQKHRDVSEIDRYECLINLIDRLKHRVAQEKKKYLDGLSEPSGRNTKTSAGSNQEHDKLFIPSSEDVNNKLDSLSSGSSGEDLTQTKTLDKKNEEQPTLFNLDPIECDASNEQLTCLRINKRQVQPPKCNCGYTLKQQGKCPCGSWTQNHARYYST